MRVMAQRHLIDGRWCDVKVPNSKVNKTIYFNGIIYFSWKIASQISIVKLYKYPPSTDTNIDTAYTD